MSLQTVDGPVTTGDNDYIATTGTLTFASGETTKTITIFVKGDSKEETNETFYLDLFGLSSNALFTKNRGLPSHKALRKNTAQFMHDAGHHEAARLFRGEGVKGNHGGFYISDFTPEQVKTLDAALRHVAELYGIS